MPAQRGAGVTKAMTAGTESAELAALKKEAALGRRYLEELRGEVKKLSLICGREFYDALAPGLEAMDADALLGLKSAFRKKAAEKLPLHSQIGGADEIVRFDGEAYRV